MAVSMFLPAFAKAQVPTPAAGTSRSLVQDSSSPPGNAISVLDGGSALVRVVAPEGTDLSGYGSFVERRIPEAFSEMRVFYGQVAESTLQSLKAHRYVEEVARIQALAEAPDTTPDSEVETRPRPSMEETRARLTELRDNPPEPVVWPETRDWWEVTAGGHNAAEAWESGYTGAGVKVAVNDSGVDMAHPDFWGTEARYENVSGDPYYDYFDGWPIALSPFSNYLMAFDLEVNGRLTLTNTFNISASMFADTSATGTGATVDFWGVINKNNGPATARNPV